MELVSGNGQILQELPPPVHRRNDTGEEVSAKMEVPEIRHFSNCKWQISGHIVVVQVQNLQALEAPELRGESFVENVVREVKMSETGNKRELRRDWADEIVGSKGKVDKEAKMGDIGGKRAREIEAGEIESDDMTSSVAGNTTPAAVASGDIPGG